MKKITINTTSFGELDTEPLDILKKRGIDITLNPYGRKLEKKEIIELCRGSVGVVAGTEKMDVDVMKVLPDLKVISRCGVGMDNVDLNAAGKLGIKVFNTPDAPTTAVAELTIALMLDCLRGISRSDRIIRSGRWTKTMGRLLEGKVVGVIGYGRIGRAVSRLCQAFGAKVLACDIAVVSDPAGASVVSFDEVISGSDIVTLHAPVERAKGYLINSGNISMMKKDSYLINTSRGELVDENAIYDALKVGMIAGVAMDVFEKEPYTGKMRELDNVVLTTHVGSYAKESRVLMEKEAVENLLKGLEGGL